MRALKDYYLKIQQKESKELMQSLSHRSNRSNRSGSNRDRQISDRDREKFHQET
jgi:hypothetical protein